MRSGSRRKPVASERRRQISRAALVAAFVAILAAVPAKAQFLMGHNWEELTKEDYEQLYQASGRLRVGTAPGTVEAWSNPKSGNRGTVKLLGEQEKNGMPCQTIEHTIKVKKRPDARTYVVQRCQLADGQWKLF